ncbi:hypothetical protein [Pseudoroseicyclus aestuarii]|uniref:Uncharacterized protein n=1 Tax=Pseudoroseicyclus aestuarii TaxID=1795041 RepID=A0A318SUU3_9RHOB|nr:hypothetical protein [Pseudoroseicyclus aestuarii]PYE84099.1 hypothetical protein DFP88_103465 [Pseudoroseicyclus aestuarii]
MSDEPPDPQREAARKADHERVMDMMNGPEMQRRLEAARARREKVLAARASSLEGAEEAERQVPPEEPGQVAPEERAPAAAGRSPRKAPTETQEAAAPPPERVVPVRPARPAGRSAAAPAAPAALVAERRGERRAKGQGGRTWPRGLFILLVGLLAGVALTVLALRLPLQDVLARLPLAALQPDAPAPEALARGPQLAPPQEGEGSPQAPALQERSEADGGTGPIRAGGIEAGAADSLTTVTRPLPRPALLQVPSALAARLEAPGAAELPQSPAASALSPRAGTGAALVAPEATEAPLAAGAGETAVPRLQGARLKLAADLPGATLAAARAILAEAGVPVQTEPPQEGAAAPFGPQRSEVRYFHSGDAARAEGLAQALGAVARDFSSYRPAPERGVVEIWLAGSG